MAANSHKILTERSYNFRPPDSYHNEEKAAMEGPIMTIDGNDLFMSIAMGTRSKQSIKPPMLETSEIEDSNIMVYISILPFIHILKASFILTFNIGN